MNEMDNARDLKNEASRECFGPQNFNAKMSVAKKVLS